MDASTAYPPQNSLQAALQPHDSSLSAAHQNREAMDSLATVQLGAEGQHEHEHDEAMRLRGGCFNMGLCGCPDCDCVRRVRFSAPSPPALPPPLDPSLCRELTPLPSRSASSPAPSREQLRGAHVVRRRGRRLDEEDEEDDPGARHTHRPSLSHSLPVHDSSRPVLYFIVALVSRVQELRA